MMLLSSIACRTAKSSRLISLGKHFGCSTQLSYFSSSSYSSETKFKYFGDERDKIAEILISEGGSKSFILENLRENRRHYTHDPISLQSTVTKKEAPFVSSPLDRQENERKVSIIGCGAVGLATAYSLLNQELCDTICLVDRDAERLEGEVKDLQQAAAFASRCRIEGSNEYDFIQDSDLIFFTAGVGQKEGESRLDLLGRNVSIMKDVMSKIIKHSPNSPVCVVSNPCDVMAAVAAKVAGDQCHPGQIFGSGTYLDTGRFKQLIATSLNLDVNCVSGYVLGEHGDSSVAMWSSVTNGGVPLIKPGTKPGELEKAIHSEVFEAAGIIIKKKGYTNWAVGMACAHIARAVLSDSRLIMPVSTCVRGYGKNEENSILNITNDVYLSVPCIIGASGVKRVIDLPMTESEQEKFQKSADIVWSAQEGIWDSL